MNDWKTEGMKGMKATIREIHWELETCGWSLISVGRLKPGLSNGSLGLFLLSNQRKEKGVAKSPREPIRQGL